MLHLHRRWVVLPHLCNFLLLQRRWVTMSHLFRRQVTMPYLRYSLMSNESEQPCRIFTEDGSSCHIFVIFYYSNEGGSPCHTFAEDRQSCHTFIIAYDLTKLDCFTAFPLEMRSFIPPLQCQVQSSFEDGQFYHSLAGDDSLLRSFVMVNHKMFLVCYNALRGWISHATILQRCNALRSSYQPNH